MLHVMFELMMIFGRHIPKLMIQLIDLFDWFLKNTNSLNKTMNNFIIIDIPFPALNGRSSPDILYGFDQPFNKLLFALK